jgi:hypothetical protein
MEHSRTEKTFHPFFWETLRLMISVFFVAYICEEFTSQMNALLGAIRLQNARI